MIISISASSRFEFFWDMTHPVTKCRIRAALRDFDRHVILVEAGLNPAPRGVLVKIMKDKEEIADAFVDQADEEKIEAEENDTDECESEADEDEKCETEECETDESEEESESGENEIHKIKVLCRFVGPVHFRTPQYVPDGTFDVRIIGAGGDDLDADVSASHYLKSKGAFKDKETTDSESDSDSAGSAD
ncbi:hypothetical protein APHAL10511_008537 [Amanita phalloides]|nr:hypothetical protein APHAL10511_008537 [Amanita phalloides]